MFDIIIPSILCLIIISIKLPISSVFKSGESLIGKKINYVFIGSCTNSRIEDFRSVANYIVNKRKANNVNALIVPGSQNVLNQIIDEGLYDIFEESGFLKKDFYPNLY